MSGIILDSGTKTSLLQHLHIKVRPLGNPLCLQQLVILLKILYSFIEFFLNRLHCTLNLLLWHNIMRSRENSRKIKTCLNLTCQYIHLHDSVNLITKKFNVNRILKSRNRNNLQYISAYTKTSSLKIKFITYILNINQPADNFIPVNLHPRTQ